MTDTTLTVDEAVAELVAAPAEQAEAPEEQEQPAKEEAAADPERETAEEDAPEGEEPEAEEDPEPKEPEAAAIEPPKTWDAEDKEWFAAQPPEVQARVLKNEEKREAVLVKAKEKARAEARQEISGDKESIAKIANAFNEYLPRIIAQRQAWFGDGKFDLVANMRAYGSEKALEMQAEWEADQENIENLVKAAKVAEEQNRRQYQTAQYERLKELRPEFADPQGGRDQREAFAKELLTLGATAEELEVIPAWGVDLALDGLKFRKAQAEAKAKAKAPLKPVAPVLKPTAAPNPSTTSDVTKLKQRLAKTGSVDDAVALLLAEEAQARRRA